MGIGMRHLEVEFHQFTYFHSFQSDAFTVDLYAAFGRNVY